MDRRSSLFLSGLLGLTLGTYALVSYVERRKRKIMYNKGTMKIYEEKVDNSEDIQDSFIHYPVARRCDHKDLFHDKYEVEDPYRWLEENESEETLNWIRGQNEVTNGYFEKLKETNDKFYDRLMELINYDKFSCIYLTSSGKYSYSKKIGLQNQYVHYLKDELSDDPEENARESGQLLVDPNTLREDGTASVSGTTLSKDGKYLAYMVSFSGSDWYQIHLKDLTTGQRLDKETIHWCKFTSVTWTKDTNNHGFFYSKYDPPSKAEVEDGAGTETDANSGHKVYYHRMNTSEENDQLVLELPEHPKWLISSEITDDGKYILFNFSESCDPVNRLYYADLRQFDGKDVATIGKRVKVIDTFDHGFNYITNTEDVFYFHTNLKARKYRVIKFNLPQEDCQSLQDLNIEEVIPEDKNGVLDVPSVTAENFFLLNYTRNIVEELEICTFEGKGRKSIKLPGKGCLFGLSSRPEFSEFFYSYTSFNDPGSIYRVVLSKDENDKDNIIIHSPTLIFRCNLKGIDLDQFTTTQEWYRSKDFTKVPMFILSSKDKHDVSVEKSQSREPNFLSTMCASLFGVESTRVPKPTILYGYGGFNISIKPSFSLSRLLYCKHFNANFAIANIRGGGEFGEEWHDAGTKLNKQNVFNDFIYAAKYLINKQYTTASQLAIQGGSNGGLLVGACINQEPQLFAAAMPAVGVMDMLRFHKFTIGYCWCSDYGNADENEADFKNLYKISPVHNVNKSKKISYPATLICTADHDDRVVPLHSFKYAAALQHEHGNGSNPNQNAPLLIRIDMKAGHGAGKPTHMVVREQSDVLTFAAINTGAKFMS